VSICERASVRTSECESVIESECVARKSERAKITISNLR